MAAHNVSHLINHESKQQNTAASDCYRRDLWQVDISLGGESILTLSHNHLGGIESISDYEEVIEKCADHLLAFVGKSR